MKTEWREGGGGLEKHSEVRPQGGQIYNSKALQHVGGEPPVFQSAARPEAILFSIGSNILNKNFFKNI